MKIIVNYEKFEEVAKKLDSYNSSQKAQMSMATTKIKNLNTSWKGVDYVKFVSAWAALNEKKSATKGLHDSIEAYANILRTVANEYKTAQQTALEYANKLK